jgi:acyclic terpene utilization AtuA family protein
MSKNIKFLSLCGMLGYGYPIEGLKRAMQEDIAFIGVDAGSTDPGPYYLGSGKGFVKEMQIRRDLEPALVAAREKDIPLIIGSAGGSGARPHVDFFCDILLDLAKKNKLSFKLAVIYADLDKDFILQNFKDGKISPCGPVPELSAEKIQKCTNPVGQMGTEPLIAALEAGADVVVAGRCCDTAIFAAMPIMKGFDPGLALHCAKIAECGALCARPVGANDSLLATIGEDYFIVEPVNTTKKCSPASTAGHSLYEQPDPNCFYEPEGKIDMSNSVFEQFGERSVKVTGTRLVPAAEETLKLEGAEHKGYRTVTIAGISDPVAISKIDDIERKVSEAVAANMSGIIDSDEYSLIFRRYGLDGTIGRNIGGNKTIPDDLGLLIEAIAPTQELADTILSLARSTALHQSFEGRKATAGNLAFPFSPSDLQGGAVYEFSIYHLLKIDKQQTIFPVKYINL